MREDAEPLPDHLAGGPTLDEFEYFFAETDANDAATIHAGVTKIVRDFGFDGGPDCTRYFVLGNYDEPQKERLRRVVTILEKRDSKNVAVLLEELDSRDDYWENFYLKFRYALSMTDYVVVVAEDNDGGHELELGEVPLADTYVLKRDYTSASIEDDLEREKYDAMMAKLCELLARNGQLLEWNSVETLTEAAESVALETG